VTRQNGTVVRRLTGRDAALTLDQAGTYTATLAVTDAQRARATAKVLVAAGNEPPKVAVDLTGNNRTFFFPGVPIHYAVRVTDREDGSLAGGRIPANRVRVTADFLKDAPPAAAAGHGGAEALLPHAEGKALIESSDCLACHKVDRTSIGPTYTAVAERYRSDTTALMRLARKVRSGGTGVWGKNTMPAHPQLTEAQTTEMVAYVLSLGAQAKSASLPVRGEYIPPDSIASSSTGVVVLRAAYTDRGANGILGVPAEATVVLRAPTVVVASGTLSDGLQKMTPEGMPVEITIVNRSGGSAKLERIDLTGVSGVLVSATAPAQYGALGGKIELHIDSASGPLVGETEVIKPSADSAAPPAQLHASLAPTSGVHDVYFVFRNEQAPSGQQMLFVVLTATFQAAPPGKSQ
jgi:cytochrome c